MGEDVEASMDGGEDLKVVQHDKFRFLRVNDFQRLLVAIRLNCSGGQRRLDDDSFILVLKAFFLFCLSLTLTAKCYELYRTTTLQPYAASSEFGPVPYIVFLGVFTAIFVISVLVRMKSRPSSQEKREEVKTISGDIQNLRRNDELDVKS